MLSQKFPDRRFPASHISYQYHFHAPAKVVKILKSPPRLLLFLNSNSKFQKIFRVFHPEIQAVLNFLKIISHIVLKNKINGSIFATAITESYDSEVAKTIQNRGDLVAQLVEHLPFKEVVLGSSPSQVTTPKPLSSL